MPYSKEAVLVALSWSKWSAEADDSEVIHGASVKDGKNELFMQVVQEDGQPMFDWSVYPESGLVIIGGTELSLYMARRRAEQAAEYILERHIGPIY